MNELYAAPREEFVPRRKDLAKAVRAAGDADVAARIEKLAKPTTAAWLANQLARSDAEDVRALAALGGELRAAHERLDGAEIRNLTQRRSELIRGLLRRLEEGHDLSEAVLRELEDIFTKAVADEQVAAALVSGRLTSAKAFAPLTGWPSLPAGEPAPKPAPRTQGSAKVEPRAGEKPEHARKRERARQALEEARAAVKEAEAERADDERSLADAEAAAAEAAAEVTRLGEELDAAEAREKRARGLVAMARRSVKEAEKRAAQAWRQVQAAEARLAELEE